MTDLYDKNKKMEDQPEFLEVRKHHKLLKGIRRKMIMRSENLMSDKFLIKTMGIFGQRQILREQGKTKEEIDRIMPIHSSDSLKEEILSKEVEIKVIAPSVMDCQVAEEEQK